MKILRVILCLALVGCGDSSDKKSPSPVTTPAVQPVVPEPIPTPSPTGTPLPTPLPTNEPNPLPTPTLNPLPRNPEYLDIIALGDAGYYMAVDGLPEDPIVVVDRNEKPTFDLKIAIYDKNRALLANDLFKFKLISSDAQAQGMNLTFGKLDLVQARVLIQTSDGTSIGMISFKLLKTTTDKVEIAREFYQFVSEVVMSSKDAHELLELANAKGKGWLLTYKKAYSYHYGVSFSAQQAHEFARKVGDKAQPEAWLTSYQAAYTFYYKVSFSGSTSHEFAETTADKDNSAAWLRSYEKAYTFFYKTTFSQQDSHTFAELAAGKANPEAWLAVYESAHSFFYAKTFSSRPSQEFALKVANKSRAVAWFDSYKTAYEQAVKNGLSHNKADEAATQKADAAVPE
ncbi:MAG TPA: hypothetical protein VE954_21250 [Oligoflexus sp.]|uniref:hypothetical protein n=1 Tax=Oligoflexus sp. TaxID=1971216 RepID=UPI002D6DE52D|nr:hypothetical protein [Oligoflexus sp.]HYX35632.1 hypothetical protein [Oligoflexus sp.]